MIGRRDAIKVAAIGTAMMTGSSSFGQDAYPTDAEVSKFIHRFVDALEEGENEALSEFLSNDVSGLGAKGEILQGEASLVAYLNTIFDRSGRDPLYIQHGGPIALDDWFVCAMVKPAYKSSMPITGGGWLLVFDLGLNYQKIAINRLTVVDRHHG